MDLEKSPASFLVGLDPLSLEVVTETTLSDVAEAFEFSDVWRDTFWQLGGWSGVTALVSFERSEVGFGDGASVVEAMTVGPDPFIG